MNLKPLAISINQFAGGGNVFGPAALFTGGEQGLWYDYNDDSTIFQDSAGTTLATWGDPVGRVNDKSGNGNNAIQSTSGARMIRGRMPKRGRVNLLAATQEFDNAYWTLSSATVTANATTAPDGTLTAGKLVGAAASANPYVTKNDPVTAAGTYALSVYAKESELKWLRLTFNAAAKSAVWFDLENGVVGTEAGTGFVSSSITTAENGFYRCTLVATCLSNEVDPIIACTNADNTTSGYSGDGNSGVFIWGAQVETNSTATAYQHVIDSLGFNVTESGQPSCGYLSFNGSNQWMQTAAAVNFSATDEMSVFAGVRKVTDPGNGIVIEANNPNWAVGAGTFLLSAPFTTSSVLRSYAYASRGTAAASEGVVAFSLTNNDPAPVTRVLAGLSKISGDTIVLRSNASQIATATGDQGAGNYGNYTLYFGSRIGTSNFFNGLMFSTIIRGALTSGTLLTRTEQYVARQTPTVNL